jgi:phage terminase large subunit-like protein
VKGEQQPYPAEIVAIRAMPYGLRGFRRFAKLLGLKVHPFQAYLLGFYFAGVIELVILIPKKNGKTTLLSVLALYHLLMVPRAEAVIGAASKEQAAILHRQATLLIEAAGLERRALPHEYGKRAGPTRYEGVFEVREGMHVIRFETGRLRVMPHEARTGDGVIPTLALVDELHRHPTGELYQVWRNGLLAGSQMITISTAGSDMDSPLGQLLTKAREGYSLEKVKKRRTYTSPSGAVVLVEYALDPDDDPDDMKLVLQANPAPWVTRKVLQGRKDSPMESVGSWARLACNLWVAGDDGPAVDGKTWDALRVDVGGLADGDTVYVATRITQQGGCGIGIAAPKDDGRIAVRAEMHPYDFPGLEAALRRLADRYDVRVIYGYAPQYGLGGVQVITDGGLPLEDQAQSPRVLMEATSTFMALVASGKLLHDGDPVLRKQVLSAIVKEAPTGSYFAPSKEVQGLIAVILAADQASQPPSKPTIHVWAGAG